MRRNSIIQNAMFRLLPLLIPLLLLAATLTPQNRFEEDKLNIIIYHFIDEPDNIYIEMIPGDRFRLPLIRGYRVRVDYNKIEIIALTDRELIEPDGVLLPSGHTAQGYSLGRLAPVEYELLITFDHQTDRHFFRLRDDTVQVRSFRDEFSRIVIP